MRRSALRNLTIGLVASVALGATANFASADDDLGLAEGEHTIALEGVGDVLLLVNEDGTLREFTSPTGFTLAEGTLEGGDELEFILTAATDPNRNIKVSFAIGNDGMLTVEGSAQDLTAANVASDRASEADAQDLDVDDESDDSEPSEASVDSEPSEASVDSEPSEASVDSEPSEPSVDESEESVDSEPSVDDDSDESTDSEPSEASSDASGDSEPSEPSSDGSDDSEPSSDDD